MKHVMIGALIFFFLYVGFFSLCSAEEMKVGTVDLSRAFDAFQKTKDAEKTLETEAGKKKEERDKRIEEVKKLKAELDLLNEKGKAEKQALIDQKIKELQQFEQEVQGSLRREKDRAIQEILKEIDGVIQTYAGDHGYTFLLNDRALLYRSQGLDVTDEIVAILNKGVSQEKDKKR